ncbi:Conserved_hypothetical protein [Hexamita inflata]|uniref:Tyrosine-protein kinase ephrin type A/B receptor-like domain-containing protein n=1 Tax=Hexamita inflata TaxID=28002 RepID=A0AA86UA49_9EUKA|nr:Conserved hypothetical protein [Hexamita inflata]
MPLEFQAVSSARLEPLPIILIRLAPVQLASSTSCLSNSTVVNNGCACDSDSYLSSNASGVLTCFKCPSGATPDNINKTCACPASQFYSFGNNTCTSCLSNSTVVNNQCACDSDSYLSSNASGVLTCFKCPSGATPDNINKTCACPASQFYSFGNNTCTSCLSNSTVVNNQCACDSDSYLSSNASGVLTCFKCPSGATPDNINKTCACPVNQFYSSGNNSCTSCLSNSTVVNNQCACDSDSYLSSNASGVLSCFKCPSGATPDNINKTCACPASQFYSSGNNSCEQCPLNSQPNIGQIGCEPILGAVKINDTYKLCPQSSIPNSNKNSCMCQLENYYFDNNSIACVLCSPGKFVNALGNQCTSCQSGYVLNYVSVCIPIQQCSGYISLDQTSCVQNCTYNGISYYIDNMNKSCVLKCGANDIKQNITSILSCKSCSLEIQNSVASADNERCECSNQTKLNLFGDQCVSECSANEFFDSSLNQCVCAAFSQIINNTCTCNSTSISFKNTCYQCNVNQTPNADQSRCICKVAQSWIGNCVLECGPYERIENRRCYCSNLQPQGGCGPNKSLRSNQTLIVMCVFVFLAVLSVIFLFVIKRKLKNKTSREKKETVFNQIDHSIINESEETDDEKYIDENTNISDSEIDEKLMEHIKKRIVVEV